MWWCMLPGNVCLVLELYLRAEVLFFIKVLLMCCFYQNLVDVLLFSGKVKKEMGMLCVELQQGFADKFWVGRMSMVTIQQIDIMII